MTESKAFLDSSIWLGYFIASIPESKETIDSEDTLLYTSIISIHEIYKKLKKLGESEKEIKEAITFIEDNSIIIGINKKIAIIAVKNCEKYDLHTIDSLIYSTAMETKAIFITADQDFKNTPNTKIIDLKK